MKFEGRLALIGGGNMGSALLKGILDAGQARPDQIVVVEKDPSRRESLARELGVGVVAGPEMAGACDVIVFAVKPQDIDLAAKKARQCLKPDTLVISVAAGVTMARLATLMPVCHRFVRAMPNTPSLIGKGATALAAGEEVTPEQAELARAIFESVGVVVDVEEKQIDAVTGLSGSGPAYVFLFIEALADAGVLQGLPRPKALELAVQTVLGSAALVQAGESHPAQLKDMVTSPGGTTITGLKVLESGGMRGLVMEAVAAAAKRSAELGN